MSDASAPGRWSAERANAWYDRQPWFVGANFVPSDAPNQLAIWQADTFNPALIDRELGWAAGIGMNSMRVFLHDLAWLADPAGFKARIRRYLDIAAAHRISTMFVLFDSVWNPDVTAGPQPAPRPHVHNSQWVQGPGRALADASQYGRLRDYVADIVASFARDERVIVWDIWNEPSNLNGGRFTEVEDKRGLVAALLPQIFAWARAEGPEQPLTAGVWTGAQLHDDPLAAIQIAHSDVFSFHDYQSSAPFLAKLADFPRDRPLLLTEFMARTPGSTFEAILPIAKREKIGAWCWGLVAGATQTIYPWDSWTRAYDGPPDPWFHDVFHPDGRPYREDEANLLRALTSV